MILKTAIQAKEITENTEIMQVPPIFHVYPMGEVAINVNPVFFSVSSVFSVANCFSRAMDT